MIISASRRTDIPALYWDWFLGRLEAGYALARNPMNAKQVQRIDLRREAADGFVFWTKNPLPAMDKLAALGDRAFYFQFTLTPYGHDIEANLPTKPELLDAMLRLSDLIGPKRVLWRYDPILISPNHTPTWHEAQFANMARALSGHVAGCTMSFLDEYKKVTKALRSRNVRTPDEAERDRIAHTLATIARAEGLPLFTCAQGAAFEHYGILPGRCVDAERLSLIAGHAIDAAPERNQRPWCRCAKSVDIGAYNSCNNGCIYCYANASLPVIEKNMRLHDRRSPFMIGQPECESNNQCNCD